MKKAIIFLAVLALSLGTVPVDTPLITECVN